MTAASQPKPPATPRRKPFRLSPPTASPQARRQAAAILEVLAGVLRPAEAAQALSTSLPRYYQLERRALTALLAACEPVLRGSRVNHARQLVVLERENRRLKRECDRQQALVRAVERSLGLALSPVAKAPAKSKDQPPESNGAKRRRRRRPTVRALKMARSLQVETQAAEGGADVLPATVGT